MLGGSPYAIEDDQEDGEDVHQRMDLLPLAAQELDRDVGDDPQADSVGDRVGKRDRGQGQEGRHRVVELRPLELASATHHHRPDQDESRRRGDGGNDLLTRFRLGRKRILDTALAATMEAAGIKKLATLNKKDFEVFPFLELIVPS